VNREKAWRLIATTRVCLTLLLCVSVCTLHAEKLPTTPQSLKGQADDLFAHGKYKEAATAYERLTIAVTKDEDVAAYARFQEGLCRLKEKRTAEAFTAWAEMRRFHPKSAYVPKSFLLEAAAPGNPSRSAKLYEEILSKYPNSMEAATVLIKQGQAACDRKDYATAAKFWRQYLDSFPNDPSVTEIKLRLEMTELALKGNAESSNVLEFQSLLPRADALFDRAQYSEAAKLYQRIADHSAPGVNAGHAVTRLAQCQLAGGHAREAFDSLQRAIDKSPANAPVLLVELVSQSASRR